MALSICGSKTNKHSKELINHGSALFPVACYDDDLSQIDVTWHWHGEWEALVITHGSAVIAVGSEKYKLRQDEGFFINTGVLHAAWEFQSAGCRLHSVVFHPRLVGGSMDSVFWQGYIQPLLQDDQLKCVHLDGSAFWHQEMISSIEAAWQHGVAEEDGYEFEVRSALSRMTALLKQNQTSLHSPPSEKELRDNRRLKIMLQYIQEHYMEELSISQIAQSAMVSESECLRNFRSTIGTPPIQYVKQFRMQQAIQLLMTTQKKVGDIGAECGFVDTSYFIKTFRELKGCTPGEYRQQGRGI